MPRRAIALMALVAAGLGLLLYPTASNWFAVRDQASELTGYAEAVSGMPGPEQTAMLDAAEEYNARLALGTTGTDDSTYPDYRSHLAPQPGEVMAELTIPRLKLTLPVYHGTSDEVLVRGVGHLFGTALPVGGEGTHAVLSAHSGLVSAELFTHLEDVEIGDLFSIDVVGRRLVYEVEHTEAIDPADVSKIQPVTGEDLVTLLTCTPTGVNSHRLLVRGHRVLPLEPVHEEQVIAGRNVDPGFPWWAVVLVGGVSGSGVLGRALDRPRTAKPRPRSEPRTEAKHHA